MTFLSLHAQLAQAHHLLALAEDVIIGLRSGIGLPFARTKGVFAREHDKAGLLSMLYGEDVDEQLGEVVWHEVSVFSPFWTGSSALGSELTDDFSLLPRPLTQIFSLVSPVTSVHLFPSNQILSYDHLLLQNRLPPPNHRVASNNPPPRNPLLQLLCFLLFYYLLLPIYPIPSHHPTTSHHLLP